MKYPEKTKCRDNTESDDKQFWLYAFLTKFPG